MIEHHFIAGGGKNDEPDRCSCGTWKSPVINLEMSQELWRAHLVTVSARG